MSLKAGGTVRNCRLVVVSSVLRRRWFSDRKDIRSVKASDTNPIVLAVNVNGSGTVTEYVDTKSCGVCLVWRVAGKTVCICHCLDYSSISVTEQVCKAIWKAFALCRYA